MVKRRGQVADIKKVLASVSRICEVGNRVAFEGKSGYIQNIQTGRKTDFKQENGVYTFEMWRELPEAYEGNKDKDRVEMDFVGLGNAF